MNTKIKELAEEVGIKDIGGLYGGEFVGAIRPEYLEKFAELIIRECLDQVDEFDRLTKAFLEQGIDPEIDITKEVLHNFGIE